MLTPAGAAYVIDSPPFAGVRPLAERPAAHLWQRLQLVYGVGPVTESELRAQGYGDLGALCNHPRWGKGREVVEYINNRDIPRLRLAGARDSELLSFFAPHEIAAMDIETAGFARALPVFIVGVAWSDGQNWYIRQFIARQFDEEGGVLYLASKFLSDYPALVSYNGRAFDEPLSEPAFCFMAYRPSFALHYDIYQEVRQLRYRLRQLQAFHSGPAHL